MARGELESENYDKAMLETLLRFEQLLDQESSAVKLLDIKEHATLFNIDGDSIRRMHRISAAFPLPQPVVVAGDLDMMEKSTRKFKLRIADGHVVSGRVSEGSIGMNELKSMWGTKVTVRGTMHYTANGKPRLLEADLFRSFEEGDLLFEQVKATSDLKGQLHRAKERSRGGNVVSEIWGKWPGDESIDELLEMMRDKG